MSDLLPKLDGSSELTIQPTLAQLAAMARENPDSLSEVIICSVRAHLCPHMCRVTLHAEVGSRFRWPLLRFLAKELEGYAGMIPWTSAGCSWTASCA